MLLQNPAKTVQSNDLVFMSGKISSLLSFTLENLFFNDYYSIFKAVQYLSSCSVMVSYSV